MDLELTNQIKTLVAKTKEGKIVWQHLNQNAVRWVVKDENKQYIFTLQSTPISIINGKQIFQYVFTLQTIQPIQPQQGLAQQMLQSNNEILIQLQAQPQSNAEYLPLLQELFETATEKTKKQAIEVLNKLLGDL